MPRAARNLARKRGRRGSSSSTILGPGDDGRAASRRHQDQGRRVSVRRERQDVASSPSIVPDDRAGGQRVQPTVGALLRVGEWHGLQRRCSAGPHRASREARRAGAVNRPRFTRADYPMITAVAACEPAAGSCGVSRRRRFRRLRRRRSWHARGRRPRRVRTRAERGARDGVKGGNVVVLPARTPAAAPAPRCTGRRADGGARGRERGCAAVNARLIPTGRQTRRALRHAAKALVDWEAPRRGDVGVD